MELADLGFAIRRFWFLVVAVPAVGFATALLLSYAPATKYNASSSVLFQPASADVDLRLVQFVLPSVPLEVGTDSFKNTLRESIPEDAASANWTLSATSDTTSGVVTLSADGLNPDILPVVANAAARQLIARRDTATIDVSVLDPAVSSAAEAPRRTPILFGAAVLGAIIGLFAAIVAAQLKPRFRRPEDVADRFGLRLLGEVPRVRASRLRPANRTDDPALAEFFKRMRLNLAADAPSRVSLAVVSYSDGDGKSSVTANLAPAPVGQNTGAAIVDADLQQPSLERYFGVADMPPSSIGSFFHAHSLEVPSDGSMRSVTLVSPTIPTGTDALARGLPDVLRRLDEELVLVDTPSLDRSADALVAAKIAGQAVLVVDIQRQTPDQVQEAIRLLREADIVIAGVVVNRTSRDIEPARVPPGEKKSGRSRPSDLTNSGARKRSPADLATGRRPTESEPASPRNRS
jgi:succinoglycan biosynthesis transport protein ExoP